MEIESTFTSSIRKYVAQNLQLSLPFRKNIDAPDKIKSFETDGARYKVCRVVCYNLGPRGKKNFSSDWYEVYDTEYPDSDLVDGEEVFSGNKKELADFLLDLDLQQQSFSYDGRNDDGEPDYDENGKYIIVWKPLKRNDIRSLDKIMRQKIDTFYRK